jgi:hypothetical protein
LSHDRLASPLCAKVDRVGNRLIGKDGEAAFVAIDRRVRSGWPALNAPISLSVSETVGVGTLIHHVSVGTTDIKRARTFYDPLMALIGFRLINARTIRTLWCIGRVETPIDGNPSTAGSGMHIVFVPKT